jgi:GntR family transcriptional regulator, rspAB operon transcriptional repressor
LKYQFGIQPYAAEEVVSDFRPPDLVRTNVYQRLRADILSCALRPGLQLQERELVERFEVSKSPIRDALLKLEEQGLIEVLPRRGYRVRRIDIPDVRDMYEMRQIYEREALSRLMDTAPASTLEELNRFRIAPQDDSVAGWLDYNRAFHAFFPQYCGNARLARAALAIIEQFDRLTFVSVTQPGENLSHFVSEHARIIDAVQTGNRREALTLAREHIEASRRRVIQNLEQQSVIDTSPEKP